MNGFYACGETPMVNDVVRWEDGGLFGDSPDWGTGRVLEVVPSTFNVRVVKLSGSSVPIGFVGEWGSGSLALVARGDSEGEVRSG